MATCGLTLAVDHWHLFGFRGFFGFGRSGLGRFAVHLFCALGWLSRRHWPVFD